MAIGAQCDSKLDVNADRIFIGEVEISIVVSGCILNTMTRAEADNLVAL